MGVIMIKICFSSFLSGLPYERLSGSEVVDYHHLGSMEVNDNKIKLKWAILYLCTYYGLRFIFPLCSHFCPNFESMELKICLLVN
jgi:hypothetical protein